MTRGIFVRCSHHFYFSQELIPTPDENGDLELTYRAAHELDPVVWTMGKELQRLDVSFNRITYFPSELGDLKLLVELNDKGFLYMMQAQGEDVELGPKRQWQ